MITRKERIDALIEELDAQYQPDTKFKNKITPLIKLLYSPETPEEQMDMLLSQVKDTYARHSDLVENSRKSVQLTKQIGNNLKEFGRLYAKSMHGVANMIEGLQTIAEKAEQTEEVVTNCKHQTANALELVTQQGKVLDEMKDAVTEARTEVKKAESQILANELNNFWPKKPTDYN